MTTGNLPDLKTLAAIEQGLRYDRYPTLVAALGLPARRINALLGISARTVGRRRRQGRFNPAESDRIVCLERTWQLVLAAFGEVGMARGWLGEPKRSLGGRSPLKLLATETGRGIVQGILERIEVAFDL